MPLHCAKLALFLSLAAAATCFIAGCQGLNSNTGTTQKPGSPTPTPTPSTAAGYLTWKNNNARTGLQPNET
ncbi:MAG TPA: hypothetical protein VF532_12830, partial [Candidatus Angelobacter sp.]